jgi:hypothetical protein
MHTSTGVLTEVKVAGPFQSSKGYKDYFRHTYAIGDLKFSKILNKKDPLFEEGATVTVLYESIKTEKGIFNQIDKIVEAETGTAASAAPFSDEPVAAKPITVTIVKTATPSAAPVLTRTTDGKISELAKNLSIARMNAVTSAIALVSNIPIEGIGEVPSLEDVLAVAQVILDFTTEPLNS